MVPQDLKSYIRVYHDFLDPGLCTKTIQSLSEVEYSKHSFYRTKLNNNMSFDDDLSVTWAQFPEKQLIQSSIWFAIERYILKDMAEFKSLYHGWHGYSLARFNKYDVNTQMHEHIDHITTLFDGTVRGIPVLSVVGTLNDDYQGGEFVMWEDHVIELRTGSIMIFPSVFLYPHRVQPVTKGVRHSYVSWVW
jgi:hypothetical protein